MRALILSDIHANLEALEAVLADAQARGGFDTIWCLGDTVGYGPDPGACIDRIREFDLVAVTGNHDCAAIGLIDASDFNETAKIAATWTAGQLDDGQREFLTALPMVSVQEPFTLVHGSLRDPIVEYLLDRQSASGTFALMETSYCLVGHSHIPFLCRDVEEDPDFIDFTEDEKFVLGDDRWIINPGGVGQPRDRDSRPSYAICDIENKVIGRHRVIYDIAKTQGKMRAASLPGHLIDRLDHGL
ncbi:MAG: metallophosphoesterase family protein [SAR202 cluster bacterium]|nr:metallophosphoesterase family protein [SAR202 cluster bacterium]